MVESLATSTLSLTHFTHDESLSSGDCAVEMLLKDTIKMLTCLTTSLMPPKKVGGGGEVGCSQ